MKKIDIDSIIDNKFFWLYFISMAFPNALDEEEDVSLADFMYENYECLSGEECGEWIDNFVQFSEEAMDENDGYIDDPTAVELLLNNNNFRIEFHPGAALYIFNSEEIGETSGNFKLRTLSWEDFNLLISGCTDHRIPLLILPVLALEESMISKAKEIITAGLSLLDLKKEHIKNIAEMIICGLL